MPAMTHPFRAVFGALLLLSIVPASVSAQTDRPWRLFGRPADKTAAKAIDPRRQAEIQIELAWLADPVTFPYFLEARTTSAGLVVRGYVPNKAVHEQAVNLAKVQ